MIRQFGCVAQGQMSHMRSLSCGKPSDHLPRDFAVQVDGLMQLLLLDVLALSVRHVNRARTDQQRFAPLRQCGNVGGEGGDHSGQAVDGSKAQEGKFQREGDLNLMAGSGNDLLS